MAKGKRFYRNNNGKPGENTAIQQDGNVSVELQGKKDRNSNTGPYNRKTGNPEKKQENSPSGGQSRKPGSKPHRKFYGKQNRGNDTRNSDRMATGFHVNRPDMAASQKPGIAANGKVLVVFFSWSGVTEKAARKIVSAARGNIWRILPAKAYPSMYALCVAKAGMEKASGARPEIKGSLPDCRRYEKIAIGFPIWWFSCPYIIHSFLEKVNLDGKKVYPFCTSKSSGPRSSAADIRKTVPKAEVRECLDANTIDSMTDEDIRKWLEL